MAQLEVIAETAENELAGSLRDPAAGKRANQTGPASSKELSGWAQPHSFLSKADPSSWRQGWRHLLSFGEHFTNLTKAFGPLSFFQDRKEGWGASKSKTLKLGFPVSKPTSPSKWPAYQTNWHKCAVPLSRSPSPTEGQVARPHRRLKSHVPWSL